MPIADALSDAEVFTDGDWVESKDQDPGGDVRLTQLADVGDGRWINKSARFLTSEKAKQLRCTYLKPGDLLVARMPDPLGRCCVFPGDPMPCVTVVDVCVIRPNQEKIDNRYLMHVINSPRGRQGIARHITGTTRQRISRKNLGKVEISLPPLAEQKRIAGILDAADALRAKRRESIAQLDTLIQSTFLEMFGDPVTNPMRWDVKSLADSVIVQGGFAFKSKDFCEEGIRLVKISNVHSGNLLWDEIDCVPAPYLQRYKDFSLQPGDVVIALTRPIIKSLNSVKIATVGETDAPSLLNQRVARFVFSPNSSVTKPYLLAYCRTQAFKSAVRRFCSESLQPNMSTKQLGSVQIAQPPLDLQQRFAAIVETTEQQNASQRAHLAELDTLFASLQSRAFTGEL